MKNSVFEELKESIIESIKYVGKDRLSVIPQTSPNGDFSNEKEHNIRVMRRMRSIFGCRRSRNLITLIFHG